MATVTPEKGEERLKFVCKLLTDLCKRNDESHQEDAPVSRFHGLKAPPMTLFEYLKRILEFSRCEPSTLFIAMMYVDRITSAKSPGLSSLVVNSLTVHRLLLTSILLAIKYYDDFYFTNSYYGRIGGITNKELNQLESDFLYAIKFDLSVSPEDYQRYIDEVGDFESITAYVDFLQKRGNAPQVAKGTSAVAQVTPSSTAVVVASSSSSSAAAVATVAVPAVSASSSSTAAAAAAYYGSGNAATSTTGFTSHTAIQAVPRATNTNANAGGATCTYPPAASGGQAMNNTANPMVNDASHGTAMQTEMTPKFRATNANNFYTSSSVHHAGMSSSYAKRYPEGSPPRSPRSRSPILSASSADYMRPLVKHAGASAATGVADMAPAQALLVLQSVGGSGGAHAQQPRLRDDPEEVYHQQPVAGGCYPAMAAATSSSSTPSYLKPLPTTTTSSSSAVVGNSTTPSYLRPLVPHQQQTKTAVQNIQTTPPMSSHVQPASQGQTSVASSSNRFKRLRVSPDRERIAEGGAYTYGKDLTPVADALSERGSSTSPGATGVSVAIAAGTGGGAAVCSSAEKPTRKRGMPRRYWTAPHNPRTSPYSSQGDEVERSASRASNTSSASHPGRGVLARGTSMQSAMAVAPSSSSAAAAVAAGLAVRPSALPRSRSCGFDDDEWRAKFTRNGSGVHGFDPSKGPVFLDAPSEHEQQEEGELVHTKTKTSGGGPPFSSAGAGLFSTSGSASAGSDNDARERRGFTGKRSASAAVLRSPDAMRAVPEERKIILLPPTSENEPLTTHARDPSYTDSPASIDRLASGECDNHLSSAMSSFAQLSESKSRSTAPGGLAQAAACRRLSTFASTLPADTDANADDASPHIGAPPAGSFMPAVGVGAGAHMPPPPPPSGAPVSRGPGNKPCDAMDTHFTPVHFASREPQYLSHPLQPSTSGCSSLFLSAPPFTTGGQQHTAVAHSSLGGGALQGSAPPPPPAPAAGGGPGMLSRFMQPIVGGGVAAPIRSQQHGFAAPIQQQQQVPQYYGDGNNQPPPPPPSWNAPVSAATTAAAMSSMPSGSGASSRWPTPQQQRQHSSSSQQFSLFSGYARPNYPYQAASDSYIGLNPLACD